MESIENIVINITNSVLGIANKICVNSLSNKTLYIETDANELYNCQNFFKEDELIFKMLMEKELLNCEKIAKKIEDNYDKMQLIDFMLYYTCRKFNVIIVIFVAKEDLNKKEDVRFHCNVPTPSFLKEGEKFNLNWKHNSFLSKIKLWFWQQKIMNLYL